MVYACIPYNHYFTSHVLCLHLSPFSAARNFHFGFHCKALPFHNSQCLYHGHFSVPSFSISTFPTFFPPRGILYITYARIPYDHHLASRVLCLHLIPFFSPHGISILASIANHCLFITVNAFNMGIFLFHPFLSPPFLTIAFSLIFCYTYPIRFDYLLVCSYEPLIFIIPGNRFHIIYRSKPRHTVCLIFFAVVWPFRPIIHRRRL